MPTLEAYSQRPYAGDNGVKTAFALTSVRLATKPGGMYSLCGNQIGSRVRELILTPFGRGIATNTFDTKVFVVKSGSSSLAGKCDDYDRELWCSFTSTLGTLPGVSSDGPTSSDLMANAISAVTMSAYATAMLASKGAIPYINHSPTGAAQARLIFPDMCNHEFVQIEGMRTAGAAGAASYNWLVEKGT